VQGEALHYNNVGFLVSFVTVENRKVLLTTMQWFVHLWLQLFFAKLTNDPCLQYCKTYWEGIHRQRSFAKLNKHGSNKIS